MIAPLNLDVCNFCSFTLVTLPSVVLHWGVSPYIFKFQFKLVLTLFFSESLLTLFFKLLLSWSFFLDFFVLFCSWNLQLYPPHDHTFVVFPLLSRSIFKLCYISSPTWGFCHFWNTVCWKHSLASLQVSPIRTGFFQPPQHRNCERMYSYHALHI